MSSKKKKQRERSDTEGEREFSRRKGGEQVDGEVVGTLSHRCHHLEMTRLGFRHVEMKQARVSGLLARVRTPIALRRNEGA